jgi:hypothetical protein
MRPIHDPGYFAIRSDLFLVVAAAVVGDFEDFVSEVLTPDIGAPEHTTGEIPDCGRVSGTRLSRWGRKNPAQWTRSVASTVCAV